MATLRDTYYLLKSLNEQLNTCLKNLNEVLLEATPKVDLNDPIYIEFFDNFRTPDSLPLNIMTAAAAQSGLVPTVNYQTMLDNLTYERIIAIRTTEALEKKNGSSKTIQDNINSLTTQIFELDSNILQHQKTKTSCENQIAHLKFVLRPLEAYNLKTGRVVTSSLINSYKSTKSYGIFFLWNQRRALHTAIKSYVNQGGTNPEHDRQLLELTKGTLCDVTKILESLQKQKLYCERLQQDRTSTLDLINKGKEAVKSDQQIYCDILTSFFRHLAKPSCTEYFLKNLPDVSSSNLALALIKLMGNQKKLSTTNDLIVIIKSLNSKVASPIKQLASQCSRYANTPVDNKLYLSVKMLENHVRNIEQAVAALQSDNQGLWKDNGLTHYTITRFTPDVHPNDPRPHVIVKRRNDLDEQDDQHMDFDLADAANFCFDTNQFVDTPNVGSNPGANVNYSDPGPCGPDEEYINCDPTRDCTFKPRTNPIYSNNIYW